MRALFLVLFFIGSALGSLASAPPLVVPMPGTVPPGQPQPAIPRGRDYYFDRTLSAVWWHPAPGPITRIEVHLSRLKLYGYQGDALVAIAPVSTGREGHSTPPGHYTVLEKDPDHHSTEYGEFYNDREKMVDANATPTTPVPPGLHYEAAPMPNYLRLTWDGVGMHAGYLPGYAASHGCIRMPKDFSKDLYDRVDVGTPVTIVP